VAAVATLIQTTVAVPPVKEINLVSANNSRILVSAKSWYQQSSGVSKILVPEKFWCQKSSGVSKVLVSANPGTRKVLVPEELWCQQSSGARRAPGVSKVLVSAKSWYQKSSGARRALVSAKFWCQQITQLFLILISNRLQNFRIHNAGSIEHRTVGRRYRGLHWTQTMIGRRYRGLQRTGTRR
jgi:hypothetical protein